jgi:hypothetical protein
MHTVQPTLATTQPLAPGTFLPNYNLNKMRHEQIDWPRGAVGS